MPIASVIFMQDDEGRRVVDALTHTTEDGLFVRGATAASIEAVVDYLAQWDSGEYHDIGPTTRAGVRDDRSQVDAYLLTWNAGLGYVGLEVLLDDETHQVVDVTTCRYCDQPIDYCLDHTHAPDTESAEWTEDYAATMAAIDIEENRP
jgi:hypothetical protein